MPARQQNCDVWKERIKRLNAVIRARKEAGQESWSVIVAQIDPDGIATAFIVKALLATLGAKVDGLYYAGGFGHPQNKILYNEFELMKHMKPISEMPEDTVKALADSSRFEDSRLGRRIPKEMFGLVVDHHLEALQETSTFLPIIESCGAAATNAIRLLCASGGDLDERLCDLAAVGILSDTDRLTHPVTKQADRDAFAEVMRKGNQELIDACFNYALPERYLELYREVLANETVLKHVRIGHTTSLLREDEGDYLSIMADSLRKVQGAETVVVWGVPKDAVRASVRTHSKDLDLTAFIEAVFGKGNGGAKHGSGGARYRLAEPHIPFADTSKMFIEFLDAQYRHFITRFFGSPEEKPRPPQDEKAPT